MFGSISPEKHAAEFQQLQLATKAVQFVNDTLDSVFVFFLDGHFQQLFTICEAASQLINSADNRFEGRTFLTQFLGISRIIPDIRIFQLALYFLQSFALVSVVKDTP